MPKTLFEDGCEADGACVVRLLPNGIAVKFIEKQTVRDLDRLVARTVPVAAMSAVMV